MTRRRDDLGRPLPSEAQEDAPNDARINGLPIRQPTTIEALTEAEALLDAGRPFDAHELLEERWRCCPPEEREFWRALARLAAAVTHAARGNSTGAYSVGRTSLAELLTALRAFPPDVWTGGPTARAG